jgi:hypothetical protein
LGETFIQINEFDLAKRFSPPMALSSLSSNTRVLQKPDLMTLSESITFLLTTGTSGSGGSY